GHDEYWSADQRASVQAARDAGVNLAFFSGNELFWKTRWEPSADGSSTPGRTLVAYKDTHFDAPTDPVTWTGSWRDPRFGTASGAGNPENALTGQFFLVNSGTTDIQVPDQFGQYRLWRNTDAANLSAGQTLTLGSGIGTLGYEWDIDADNGFQPAGVLKLSSTTVDDAEVFTDYGSQTAQGKTATHNLTLYKAPSGALVFGAGTVQWPWGLDGFTTGKATDRNMQQATVNLFADMGTQPATLAAGLVAATASTDTTAPVATITSPVTGTSLADGTKVTISGTASDAGGVVAGVEISTDGGTSWHPANGTTNWSYSWLAHGTPSSTIKVRATDDSGNIQGSPAGITVNIACPCSMYGTNATPTATGIDSGDNRSSELGVRFTSDAAGTISAIRFYKGTSNKGTHVGSLWTTGGQLLATGTFANETATGWQTLTFAQPVAVAANTTYVASYFAPVGHYSQEEDYFYPHPSASPAGNNSVDSPPLHFLRNTASNPNGLYSLSTSSTFPTQTYRAEYYWIDVVFNPSTPVAPAVTSTSPASGATGVAANTAVSATFNQAVTPGSVAFTLKDAANATVTGTLTYDGATNTTTLTPTAALADSSTYTATISGATNSTGQTMTAPYSWTFTTVSAPPA
ncbi:DUF4082 domain-containing protein, partial [Arthrobacter sp. NPDC080031]|uniref:DUF4082 domain-containing protein n=1 Tax=Arthrobacter sp. NPDC080031 TaxID=3155918 RepID=UPI00344C94DC